MRTKTLFAVLVVAALCTAVLAGCGGSEPAAPADDVTLQLKWVHQAQFAGYYLAEAQGLYADENINITFAPGGVGINPTAELESGNADFAIISADGVLLSHGPPCNVTAVATIFRINPYVLVALAESGISTPADFSDRVIAVSNDSNRAVVSAMMQRSGVDPATAEFVRWEGFDAFLDGDVEVTSAFAAGSLSALRADAGDRELNVLWPGDFGVHFYSDTIVACKSLIDENPDLVLRFLRASVAGHRAAIGEILQAVDAAMPYADVQDRAVQEAMFTASIPLIDASHAPLGVMDPDVWQDMHDTMVEYDLIAPIDDIAPLYTNQFMEEIYEQGN